MQETPHPLKMWNKTVLRTTQLSMERDIKPSYVKMLNVANEQIFGGKLSDDPRLFLDQTKIPYNSSISQRQQEVST